MKLKTLLLVACIALPSIANASTYINYQAKLKDARTELNNHGIHHEFWRSSKPVSDSHSLKLAAMEHASKAAKHAIESNSEAHIEDVSVIAKALIGAFEVYPLSDNVIDKLDGDVKSIHRLKSLYEKRRLPNVSKMAINMIAKDIYRNQSLIILVDNYMRSSDYNNAFIIAQIGFKLNGENANSNIGQAFVKRLDQASQKMDSNQILKAYDTAVMKAKILNRKLD
ncbi:hypothetical protein LMH73_004805 [Vibrio splendidus]|nr:hypothetical protein [Vibrio splendidus]MCC4882549.1 hypothetical protein [Vibrio splendidus]